MIMSRRRKIQGGLLSSLVMSLSLLIFAACGGGSGGGSGEFTGGGIGGTGIGTITQFGSIFVNGVEYGTAGASISVDDNSSASEDDLEVGMKVVVQFDSGTTADSVVYEPEVKGPVSNVDVAGNMVIVMGQTVLVDSTTIFKNATGLSDILVNDDVEASGFFDAGGNLQATYLERKTLPLLEFEVKGVVDNLNSSAKTFTIAGITVNYSGVTTPPAFDDGSFVEAEGDSFVGNTLFADRLELEDRDLPDDEEVELEGLVTDTSPDIGDFEVSGFPVELTAQTSFENGTASDIVLNARVEVEGEVSGGVLVADEVEFRFLEESQFAFEGPVTLVDAGNGTVAVFSTVWGAEVQITASTTLKDSRSGLIPFTLDDLEVTDFVEIGGFVDNNGDLIATKLERESDPGFGEELLKGPVTGKTNANTYGIVGIQANVNGADFEDENGNSMTASQFFAAVDVGDIVELEGEFVNTFFAAVEAEIEALLP